MNIILSEPCRGDAPWTRHYDVALSPSNPSILVP